MRMNFKRSNKMEDDILKYLALISTFIAFNTTFRHLAHHQITTFVFEMNTNMKVYNR